MNQTANLPIASMKKRIFAFVIDDLLIAMLVLLIFSNQLYGIASHLPTVVTPESIEIFKTEMNQFSVNNLFLIIALKIIYHTYFVGKNGMTLGKYVAKVRVIDLNTREIPVFSKALLRAVARIASEVIFYLGFMMAFFTPLRQTFHDKVSNCVVIDV